MLLKVNIQVLKSVQSRYSQSRFCKILLKTLYYIIVYTLEKYLEKQAIISLPSETLLLLYTITNGINELERFQLINNQN